MRLKPVNRAGHKASTTTLPAPTGGWNTRDAAAAMAPEFAREMVNLFPTPTSVELRAGFNLQATITNGGNDIIMASGFVNYADSSLWAVGRIEGMLTSVLHDVIGGNATTLAMLLPQRPRYVQFSNSGGTYVCVVFTNLGSSLYYTYDGSTWTDRGAATSGYTAFKGITAHQNRLWFRKSGDINAYYLASQAITGTPTSFPLGGIATKGGSLASIGTWTVDGGLGGMDDMIVFVTSNGQVIVYEGIDPGSAASFALRGVFDISKPIAEVVKFGADLLIPCEDGLYSMAEILRGNTGVEYTVSSIIRPSWQAAAVDGIASTAGISSAYSARLNMLIFNFPTSAVSSGPQTSVWFVMNTITKAWTKFTGLDAWTIDQLAGYPYFGNVTAGGSGTLTVYKFGSDGNDNGAAITGYCRQAYTYLGAPGIQKCVTGLLPSFANNGTYSVGFLADWDFSDRVSTTTTQTNERSYSSGSYRPLLSFPVTAAAISVFCELTGDTVTRAPGLDYFRWFNTTVLAIPGGVI